MKNLVENVNNRFELVKVKKKGQLQLSSQKNRKKNEEK